MGDDGAHIVFAGGGTGGHLFPALAVADELRRRHPAASIVFFGARRGIESRLVPQAGYPLRLLRLAGMQGRGVAARAAAAAAAAWAVVVCRVWLARPRARLVVGVGGYASGPAVLAATRMRGVRTMILEQNHWPGATNRWLAPRVDAVCAPSEDARVRLGGRGEVTGTPVRREFAAIGEPPGGPALSLLVFGGSRGARSINTAVAGALGELARLDPPPRICHQTGADDEDRVRRAYADYPGAWEVVPFLDDMPARLAAADLVVCRAGASTLAELAVAGRPAILVPYPHAADDHQRRNAETVRDAGAAVVLDDRGLDGPALAAAVAGLAAAPDRRAAMAEAARTLGRADAAARIADVADRLLGGEVARVP